MQYPAFVENSKFIAMDVNNSENDQLKAMLDNLTRVHLLTAREFDDFDHLIHEYLQCGIDVFGLETGIVSYIDDQKIYHVRDVISPVEALVKGMEFPLADTYCKEVYKTEKVIGFPKVGDLDFMNCHPVYQNLKLEAYLSSPIYVNGKLYGTFNFTSTTPRENGFSEHEHNLIQLMANAIGNFVLLRSKEDKLLELNKQLHKFVGFVSHDLRNPIAGIIGISRILEKKTDNQSMLNKMLPKITQTAESALDLVGNILDNSAISTGKININKQSCVLKEIFEEVSHSVEDIAEHQKITLNWPNSNDLKVHCDFKLIKQVLINILINAVKYSPKENSVDILLDSTNEQCFLKIENEIDKSEQGHALPKVYDSVGFGLEIVDTILNAHNASLKSKATEDQYCVEFVLDIK